MILCRVDSDAIEPGVKGAVAAKTGQRAVGFDKRFLGDILHFIGIVHIAADQAHDLLLVLDHQQIEGAFIAGLNSLDKLFVCHRRSQTSYSSLIRRPQPQGISPRGNGPPEACGVPCEALL